MAKDKKYHLKEAYRHLELALVEIRKKNRDLIEKAIEHLELYEKKQK